jgi:hypothetical protein
VWIVFVHLVGLALTVLGILRSGERPPVLVYAFIIEFLLRLVTIQVILSALKANMLESAISYVTISPELGQRSYAPVYEETRQPIPFHTYIIVVLVLAAMAFVIVNVGADKQIHVDAETLVRDLRWAFALAAIYWLEGLIARTITIDRDAPGELNLGYNARDIVILAFADLTAGAAVAARQMSGLNSSGWVVLAPLLVVRFFFDVSSARAAAKRGRR